MILFVVLLIGILLAIYGCIVILASDPLASRSGHPNWLLFGGCWLVATTLGVGASLMFAAIPLPLAAMGLFLFAWPSPSAQAEQIAQLFSIVSGSILATWSFAFVQWLVIRRYIAHGKPLLIVAVVATMGSMALGFAAGEWLPFGFLVPNPAGTAFSILLLAGTAWVLLFYFPHGRQTNAEVL